MLWRNWCRRFLRAESGAVAAFVIVLFPLFVLVGGLATDVSLLNAQKRYTQAQADLAAQSAVRYLPDPVAVRAEVRRVVSANTRYGALTLADSDIVMGSWAGPGQFTPLANQSSIAGASAVRVSVPSPFRPFLWSSILGEGDQVIRRHAIARSEAYVVFTLRNRLLGLNTKSSVLNHVLGPLGLGVTTSLLNYNGLANADVGLNNLLGLVVGNVQLQALTFNELLNLPISVDSLLNNMISTKKLPLASVLYRAGGRGTLKLGDFIKAEPGLLALRAVDVLPNITLSAFDMLMAVAALTPRFNEVLGISAGLDLYPLAAVNLDLGVTRPPVTVIARPSDHPPKVAKLDQLSLGIKADVLAAISLQAGVNVAGAEARLISVDCGGAGSEAVFQVVTYPVSVAVSLGLGLASTRAPRSLTPVALSGATREVRIPLSQVGKVYPINNPISLSGAIGGLNSVLKSLRADAEAEKADLCKGLLGCVAALLGVVLGAVLSLLNAILDALVSLIDNLGLLDQLLNALLKILGIDVAQAELILNEAGCEGGGLAE